MTDWMDDAACRSAGLNPDLWTEKADPRAFWGYGDQAAAIRVCKGCPVRRQCLEHALRIEGGCKREDRWAIYGGLTPQQREDLYRVRRAS